MWGMWWNLSSQNPQPQLMSELPNAPKVCVWGMRKRIKDEDMFRRQILKSNLKKRYALRVRCRGGM